MKQNFFAIIQQLGERDRCGVLQLQGQPRVLQCLCRDKFASLEKMRMIKREGSAEIFRGIEKAYEMLIKKPGAKEIILMTDAPVCGERKLRKSQQKIVDTIVRRCRVSGVRLHVIGFGQGIDDDALLSQLVSETGGRFMVHPTPYELNYEFKRVLYSTPAEYRVAWISPQRLPRHQKYCMQVKVNAEEGSGAKKIKFTP
jgi:hypothetical protein